MTATERPVGLRLHNPGLIPLTNTRWQGAVEPEQGDTIVRFQAPQFGIAAMARRLLACDARGQNTIESIVSAWALPAGVDRAAITGHVAASLAVDPGDWLDIDDAAVAAPLVRAMIEAINGRQPYGDTVIMDGLRRGRIHNAPQKSLWRQTGFTLPTIFAGLNGGFLLTLVPMLGPVVGGLAPFAVLPELRTPIIVLVGVNTALGLLLAANKARKQAKGLNA